MTESIFYSKIRHNAKTKGICYRHGRDDKESSYHEFYWPHSRIRYVAQITRSPIPGKSWWYIYRVMLGKNGLVETLDGTTTDEASAVESAFLACIND